MNNFKKMPLIIIIAIAAAIVLSGCFGVKIISDEPDNSTTDENEPKTEASSFTFPWGGNMDGKEMTLEDVRLLAAKGDDLLFEDLWQYKGGNVSSNFERYIMVYKIEGGYRLVVHSNPTGRPDAVNLESIWESGGSGIDIRYNVVDEFLSANTSQDAITEEEAQDMGQSKLKVELELVSWNILGDWPINTEDKDAVFAEALLDSIYTIDEPSWTFRVKSTAEWGGSYYSVGKKTGTIFICSFDDSGKPIWSVMDSESNP
ncbi:MAG TPA: hypothetical protein PKY98_01270 [Sedimentibacter sp.]|nr:hypothetical protein [Sedimentibacter sp.]